MTGDTEDPTTEESTFGLGDVLDALRRDLLHAQSKAKGGASGLFVQGAEVELAFTVSHGRDGKTGINLKVFGVGFDAGGRLASSSEMVHRIKLTLGPPVGGGGVGETKETIDFGAPTTRPAQLPVAKANKAPH